MARPKKWKYTGDKKITTIRITDIEKEQILRKHESVQAFVQYALKLLMRKETRIISKED